MELRLRFAGNMGGTPARAVESFPARAWIGGCLLIAEDTKSFRVLQL